MESCLEPMIDGLRGLGCQIIVRPHPQYIRRNPEKIQALQARYAGVPEEEVLIQTDFSSNETVYGADLLITDWSGIAYEYSFATCKPTLFIDTPMKTINPSWEAIGVEPIDIRLRRMIGTSLAPDAMDKLPAVAGEMLEHAGDYAQRIAQVRSEVLYNPGDSARAAGKYLLSALSAKRNPDAKKA